MSNTPYLNSRLSINIPFSIQEVIKRIEEMRVGDGRTYTSKAAIAVELMDIGARVQTKKLDAMERGESLYQNQLEEQLSFIAHNVVRANQKVERLIKIYTEHQNVDRDLLVKIIEHTPLKEREVHYLKLLFASLENYDYE